MSREAESMILQKVRRVNYLTTQRTAYLAEVDRNLGKAETQLENTVAFLVSKRSLSLNRAATLLGCSRDKVRGMVKRANERNIALMRGETNA